MVKYITLFLVLLLNINTVFANSNVVQNIETVVVEDTVLQKEKQSKVIKVINNKDLTNTKATNLVDALTTVLGGSVSSYGKYQKGAIYLKGSSPHSTVILLNGIKLVDLTSGSFDIGQIPLTAVDKIEIISGNESIAYGSEATGGVINIITKDADKIGANYKTEVNGEYGSLNTYNLGIASAFVNSNSKRMIAVNFNGSKNYSTSFADNQSKDKNGDKDKYDSASGFLNYNFTTEKIGEFDFGLSVNYAKVNYDPFSSLPSRPSSRPVFPYFYLKDTNNVFFEKQNFLFYTKYNVYGFGLNHYVNISYYQNYKKEYENFAGSGFLTPKNNKYSSNVININYKNNWQIFENNTLGGAFLISGVDAEIERFTQNINAKDISIQTGVSGRQPIMGKGSFGLNKTTLKENKFAGYTSLNYTTSNNININLGARVNFSDYYKQDIKSNYNLGVNYIQNTYKVRSNAFIAYKNPNLFELYDYESGALVNKQSNNFNFAKNNKELKQEQIKGFDIGGDLYLLDNKLTISTTYFYNYIKNLISLKYSVETTRYYGEPQRTYSNKNNGVGIQGIIFNTNYDINNYFGVSLGYNYTYLNNNLPRRPKNSGNLGFRATYNKLNNYLNVVAVSKNLDGFDVNEYNGVINHKVGDWYAKGYVVVNFVSQYNFTQNFNTYVKVNNIFNKRYQPAYGFANEPFGVFVGLNVKY